MSSFKDVKEWLQENNFDFFEEDWECEVCDGYGTVTHRRTDYEVECSACDGEGSGKELISEDKEGNTLDAEEAYKFQIKKDYEMLQQNCLTFYNTNKKQIDKDYYNRIL